MTSENIKVLFINFVILNQKCLTQCNTMMHTLWTKVPPSTFFDTSACHKYGSRVSIWKDHNTLFDKLKHRTRYLEHIFVLRMLIWCGNNSLKKKITSLQNFSDRRKWKHLILLTYMPVFLFRLLILTMKNIFWIMCNWKNIMTYLLPNR